MRSTDNYLNGNVWYYSMPKKSMKQNKRNVRTNKNTNKKNRIVRTKPVKQNKQAARVRGKSPKLPKTVTKTLKKRPERKISRAKNARKPMTAAKPPHKAKAEAYTATSDYQRMLEKKLETQISQGADLFNVGKRWTWKYWLRKYSPVSIPLFAGLITYLYLVFFVFYPDILVKGHYVQLLFFVLFIFLLIGFFIYLGIESELLFVRILSLIFLLVVLSFMILFVLLSYVVAGGATG